MVEYAARIEKTTYIRTDSSREYFQRVIILDMSAQRPGANQKRRNSLIFGKGYLLSTALNALPKPLFNSAAMGLNSKRRKIMFIPPSTQSPLFVYNNDVDQRSFLSLCSGSHLESERNSVIADDASVSTFRSLPSTLDGGADPDSMRWLVEEHERRASGEVTDEDLARYRNYGSIDMSDEEEDDSQDVIARIDQRFKDSASEYSHQVSTENSEDDEDFAHEIVTANYETKKLVRYSLPLICTFFLEQLFTMVCVITVGHLGKTELAAVSIASMTSTIVFAIFEGISTALDTLCPQAYGAGKYTTVGIHFQRCSAFSLVLFVPISLIWWFSGAIFTNLLEDQEVVRLTQEFLRILILAGPPYIIFENGKRYLQAQGIFDAGTIILLITAPVNILLSFLLVYNQTIGLGFVGAPIAACVNFWLMFILMVLYIIYIDGMECWGGFTKEAFTRWYDLSKLAIPGVVMLEAESLAYELLTLIAARYGTVALAAQSGLSSLVSLLYMVPFAVSVASSTRVANFVGSGNVNAAKISINVGVCITVGFGFINGLIILLGGHKLARLFTDDLEVVDYITSLCPLIAVFEIFDSISIIASANLRALALQGIGGVVNLVGYYFIGVPAAYVFSVVLGLKIEGLWLGNGLGLMVIGIVELLIVYHANWKKIVQEAKERLENDGDVADC